MVNLIDGKGLSEDTKFVCKLDASKEKPDGISDACVEGRISNLEVAGVRVSVDVELNVNLRVDGWMFEIEVNTKVFKSVLEIAREWSVEILDEWAVSGKLDLEDDGRELWNVVLDGLVEAGVLDLWTDRIEYGVK